MSNIVIVESPAKAKTINKYLGSDYKVFASYGHVRDIPSKSGAVRPEDDFAMDWETTTNKHLSLIIKEARSATHLYLATDPDREGEAIAWHIQEILKEKKILKNLTVERVAFNAITKSAILEAFQNPRALNTPLIEAYLARRALDYLVGFGLSPVLWRKLPGARSAGRVQSVALRLVCERESEIEIFKPQEYWTVEAFLTTEKGETITARLTHLNGEKLDKFSLSSEATAQEATKQIKDSVLSVSDIEKKQVKRHPSPPFITSTLQQEAFRKLGFGASQTMRVAQRLYEAGLITYMRTDGIQLSPEAVSACRSVIKKRYGEAYLPAKPRVYKSKVKNAQEAHEAIRPTNLSLFPEKASVSGEEAALYTMIWKRTIASGMESAVFDQMTINIAAASGTVALRATGSVMKFDGFIKLYLEGQDTPLEKDDQVLPPVQSGDPLTQTKVIPEQHFTQPPPRFSEASLIKRLEELGIGRPSTYAPTLQVLQDRDYVHLEKKRFFPHERGRLVTAFLENFFKYYVEYNFTADLEEQLDKISEDGLGRHKVLGDFWKDFSKAIDATKDLTITNVIDVLNKELTPHFFPKQDDGTDLQACPDCKDGRLGLKLAAKTGGFLGCSNYPDCKHTKPLAIVTEGAQALSTAPKDLGTDSETGDLISLRHGPYGPYVQRGEDKKPKRVSIPKNMEIDTITFDIALQLLALPRTLGEHPDTAKPITTAIGRYGPYVKHENVYASLTAEDDLLTIALDRALELLATAKTKTRAAPQALRELGNHNDKPVSIHTGRYGPYVKCGKILASLKKDQTPEDLTLEQAVTLITEKAASKGKKRAKK